MRSRESSSAQRYVRGGAPAWTRPLLVILSIEFFDELAYGAEMAALPGIRASLGLTYTQMGLLLGLPALLGSALEPVVMLLGDTRLRRRLILAGGFGLAAALLITGSAQAFAPLLAAFVLGYPASGAFVTLSQAALIDASRGREAQTMARWTAAGSLGALLGPLAVTGALAIGSTWRLPFVLLASLAFGLTVLAARLGAPAAAAPRAPTPAVLVRRLATALRRPLLVRWLLLLSLSDLMLDVFNGYAALYFADSVGLTHVQTGVVLSGMMAAGLAADMLAIPLLERLPPRRLVRLSAAVVLCLYPAWLVAPWPAAKVALAVVLRLATLGWYSVLQAEAYAAAPGRPGTVMALASITGLVDSTWGAVIGLAASTAGLPTAMWILLAGPLALILGIPRQEAGVTIAPSHPDLTAHHRNDEHMAHPVD